MTTGAALFNFVGGTGCRIEDSTFGGAYEALMSAVGNDTTTIQRCRIVGGGWRIMTLGGSNVTLVNNFITGGTNYGINGGIPGTTTSGANLKVWHNSVYIVHPTSGSQYCSLRWYSGAAGTEVRNNIFVDIYPTLTTSTFNLWCSGALRPAVMDYNCFFSNQAGYVPFFAGTNLTLAGWQALGFDLNSLQTDPLFISTTAVPVDLSISNLSPCVSAGTLIPTVTTDFFGLPRTVPISIGAHQGVAYNVLGVATTGPGIGDLNLSLTNITGAASEGFVLLSTDTTQPLGAGPFLGIRPDAVTWTVLGYPAVPGSPFHFPIGFPGLFPASPLVLPPGSLPGLSGVTLDAVALLLSPGFGYAGRSNVVRTTF